MTIPKTICDREHEKFEECPTGSGQPAVRTKICQDTGETIKVEFDEEGVVTCIYNEVSSVPTATLSDVVSYTVPVGKTFKLKEISFSGDSIAEYTIEVDSTIEDKKRSWWTNWDGVFLFYNKLFIAGTVIKLRVDHCSSTSGEFNGRIIGNLI